MMIRGVVFVAGLGMLGAATFAMAQENLDAGKSGAQLYAADCAVCHKLSDGMAKAHGVSLLESFLREHYAASRESATILTNYLRTAENGRLRKQSSRDSDIKGMRAKPQRRKLGDGQSKKVNENEQTSVKNPESKSGADAAKPDQPPSPSEKGEDAKPAQPN